MESPTDVRVPVARSANDRFKARRRARGMWSTAVAAAAHVAVFTLSPSWQVEPPAREPLPVELVDLAWGPSGDAASAGGASAPEAVPVAEEEGPAEAEPGLEDGPGVSGTDGADLMEQALRRRLLRRAARAPTLAEPEVAPEPELVVEPVSPQSEEATSIDASASTTDPLSALEADSLDLERLNAVRPEIAFVTPSAWVLIRNPSEVEAFLERSYRTGDLDRDASGSVGVTLWIDERGSVEWAEISRSSGRPDLDEVALELFNEVATFRPAREHGVTVSRSVTFSLTFPW